MVNIDNYKSYLRVCDAEYPLNVAIMQGLLQSTDSEFSKLNTLAWISMKSKNPIQCISIFYKLFSNILLVIIMAMIACVISGFFAYCSLEKNILNSPFTIISNDYYTGQDLLNFENKDYIKKINKQFIHNNNSNIGLWNPDLDFSKKNNYKFPEIDNETDLTKSLAETEEESIYKKCDNLFLNKLKLQSQSKCYVRWEPAHKPGHNPGAQFVPLEIATEAEEAEEAEKTEKAKLLNLDLYTNNYSYYVFSDNELECIFTQTKKGYKEIESKNDLYYNLSTIIKEYKLYITPIDLFEILKLNSNISYKTQYTLDKKENGASVFFKIFGQRVLSNFILSLVNILLVYTFINGTNWCFMPIIGFDPSDESFTFKNWVNCLTNVQCAGEIIPREDDGIKWDGSTVNPFEIGIETIKKNFTDVIKKTLGGQLDAFREFWEEQPKIKTGDECYKFYEKKLFEYFDLNHKLLWDPDTTSLTSTSTTRCGENCIYSVNDEKFTGPDGDRYIYLYDGPGKLIKGGLEYVLQIKFKEYNLTNIKKALIYYFFKQKYEKKGKTYFSVDFTKKLSYKLGSGNNHNQILEAIIGDKLDELKEIEVEDIGNITVTPILIDEFNNYDKVDNISFSPANNDPEKDVSNNKNMFTRSELPAPHLIKKFLNRGCHSTWLYKLGLNTTGNSTNGLVDSMNPEVGNNVSNLGIDTVELGIESNVITFRKIVNFITLFIVKMVVCNYITTDYVLIILLTASLVLTLTWSKRSFLHGLIQYIDGYYNYNTARFIRIAKILFTNTSGEPNEKEYLGEIYEKLIYKNDTIFQKNLTYPLTYKYYCWIIDPKNKIINEKFQTLYKDHKWGIQDYVESHSKINIGTPEHPVNLDYILTKETSSVPVSYFDAISDKIENKVDAKCKMVFGPTARVYPYIEDTGVCSYVNSFGSALINYNADGKETALLLDKFNKPIVENSLEPSLNNIERELDDAKELVKSLKIAEAQQEGGAKNGVDAKINKSCHYLPQKELCKNPNDRYFDEHNKNFTVINYLKDNVVNIETSSTSSFLKLMTKIGFLGVDLKKLFLERNRYCMPSIYDCENGKLPALLNAKLLINNWNLMLVIAILFIIMVNSNITKFVSYVPPNLALMSSVIYSKRKYLYIDSTWAFGLWNATWVVLIYFAARYILEFCWGQALSTTITVGTDNGCKFTTIIPYQTQNIDEAYKEFIKSRDKKLQGSGVNRAGEELAVATNALSSAQRTHNNAKEGVNIAVRKATSGAEAAAAAAAARAKRVRKWGKDLTPAQVAKREQNEANDRAAGFPRHGEGAGGGGGGQGRQRRRESPVLGGGGWRGSGRNKSKIVNSEKYQIRIGRNYNKRYSNKFYPFYKFNSDKNKYKLVKKLFINPKSMQLKIVTKNNEIKLFKYTEILLKDLINNL